MTFELPLTEERVKPHQVTALHLFVAFILVITASMILVTYYSLARMPEDKMALYKSVFYYGQAISIVLYAIAAVLITVVVTQNKWLQKPLSNLVIRVFELVLIATLFIASIVSGLFIPAILFGILCATIVFAISWERKKNIPLHIRVDKEGIHTPISSRAKNLGWIDVEHVILRFGTLTVNCVDNRMYQWSVDTFNFEPDVFEVFCIRQVDKAKERRDKNDW